MKPPPPPRRPPQDGTASDRQRSVAGTRLPKSAGNEEAPRGTVRSSGATQRQSPQSPATAEREADSETPSGEQSTQIVRRRVSSRSVADPSERGSSKFDLEPRETTLREVAARARAGMPRIPVLSTGVADRLAERRAIERHDRKRKRLLIVSIVLAFFVVVWLFGYSKLFALEIDHLKVSGTHKYVSEQDIAEVLKKYDGIPLTRLDLKKVQDSVLEISNVKSVTQTRRWPDGISVVIQERVPVAAVPSGKKYTLLDIDSVEVATVDKAPQGLPVIKIPMTGENQRVLLTALEILDSLPEKLLSEIGTITAETQDNVVFALRDGVKVQWGNSRDSVLKVEVLNRLRPIAHKENKKTIDLSAPTFPIIR